MSAARKAKESQEAEQRRLAEMSEEDYEALPETERFTIDMRRLELKKERINRYTTARTRALLIQCYCTHSLEKQTTEVSED